ncbi:MAG: hypothetical protein RL675_352 [Bacteroidota bacterium]
MSYVNVLSLNSLELVCFLREKFSSNVVCAVSESRIGPCSPDLADCVRRGYRVIGYWNGIPGESGLVVYCSPDLPIKVVRSFCSLKHDVVCYS